MSRIEEFRKKREEKLKLLKERGLSGYPIKTERTHQIKEVLENFPKLAKEEKEVIVSGRIISLRDQGNITFISLRDFSGEMQGFISKESLGEDDYRFFKKIFDVGDFIKLRGFPFETKRGEKSIKAIDFAMLTKSLRPLPEKWHGLQNIEERYRKRYLDLIFNKETVKAFKVRSKIVKELRNFLEEEGFMEVETPVLQPIYGGTNATPFETHHKTLDMNLYLRVAPELYLKRLLVGGWDKVFEFARCFRNEGIDRSHNPEFTMLEFYWAYADYKDMMKLTENMIERVVERIFSKKEITCQGEKLNFKTPWERVEFNHLIKKETGLDIEELNKESLRKEAEKRGIEIEKGADKGVISDEIFKKECRDKIIQPTFVIHFPKGHQPLAKSLEDEKRLASFQLIINGWEVVNAFSELNDPLEQRRRFQEQEEMRKEGFSEAQRIDEDFLEAIEYGMPPAAGFGMGIDRIAAVLSDSSSLRDIILFPTMRPKK